MARKIKVSKEKMDNYTSYCVSVDGKELAWNEKSPEDALKVALNLALNERDNLRKTLEDVQKLKQSLREFLS